MGDGEDEEGGEGASKLAVAGGAKVAPEDTARKPSRPTCARKEQNIIPSTAGSQAQPECMQHAQAGDEGSGPGSHWE